MVLQGVSGRFSGCLREDFLSLWDHSLSFPVAFSISDGHFFISNSIYNNLH